MVLSVFSSNMDQAKDSDAAAPLLEENAAMASSSRNDGDGRAVTLHGEPVDLRAMFPGGMGVGGDIPSGDDNSDNGKNDMTLNNIDGSGTNDAGEEVSPTSTLSVDDGASNAIPGRSKLDYVKQAFVFLPKKGRALYHRTRYNISTSFQSRRARRSTVRRNNTTSHRVSEAQQQQSRNRISKRSALFRSPSTPLLLKLLVPPLIIVNHVLFYHAQTAPMWNLAYKTDVSVSATASTLKAKAAADAINVPHHYEFVHKEEKVVETFTYMDAIRKLWKGEGLGDAQTISKVAAVLLVIASGIWPHLKLLLVHLCWFFPFAHRLWLGGEDKRCCCKRNRDGNTCSLCCSNGHSHHSSNCRSPFLRTLSTLGKWSLADVLVVCILIAVLHLDWKVDPDAIRTGIENELPTILDYVKEKYPDDVDDCTQLLGYNCGAHSLVIHYPACFACKTLVKNAYHHPEWTAGEGKSILEGVTLEGGGYAQLRVMGMVGTYYFCGAVIMSILLSLFVDFLDERDRARVEEDLLDRRRELEFILQPAEGGENDLGLVDEAATGTQPPLNEAFSSDDPASQNQAGGGNPYNRLSAMGATTYSQLSSSSAPIPRPTTDCRLLKQALLILLSVSSLPLVCYAVTLPTMQRLVYGGGPTLLHEVLGMVWEKQYSLVTLVKTTGDAGGWDTFLMITFGLFAVVGPILRSVCLILHVSLGLPVMLLANSVEQPRQRTPLRMVMYQFALALRRALLPAIDALGAFCCWEVLLVALVMIQLEMPSITDTIYQDDRCQQADPEHGRTCIEVQFNATDEVLVVVVAWFVLVLASGLAMDLAVQEEEGRSPLLGVDKEERYEFGKPIPQPRSNFNRDRAWLGSSGRNRRSNSGGEGGENDGGGDGEDYFSPLGSGGQQDNGLEQIVFV